MGPERMIFLLFAYSGWSVPILGHQLQEGEDLVRPFAPCLWSVPPGAQYLSDNGVGAEAEILRGSLSP